MRKIKKIEITILFLILIKTFTLSGQCNSSFSYTINPFGNVSFTNLSSTSGSFVTYNWNFGNYTYSQLANPSASYSGNGDYIITLLVRDSLGAGNTCISTSTMVISITNTVCLVNANFSYYVAANGQVYFNNTSTNTIQNSYYYWDLGNGNTSNNIAPTTSYTTSGNYSVTLIDYNSSGCSNTYTSIITVSVQPCNLISSFTSTLGSNGTVNFTNNSTGTSPTTNYTWDFGDGSWYYAANPPTHTYTFDGNYIVTLQVRDSLSFGCNSSSTLSLNITNAPCYVNSNFSLFKDSTQMPSVVWNAYPQYPSNISTATWNWGDGSSTTALYPTHTYSATGLYNICLTVSVSCGSSTTTCINSNIFKANGTASGIATISVINNTTGIKKTEKVNIELSVFPNPAINLINFTTISTEAVKIIAFDVTGKVVASEMLETGKAKMNTGNLTSGVYVYHVVGKNNQVLTSGKFNVTK